MASGRWIDWFPDPERVVGMDVPEVGLIMLRFFSSIGRDGQRRVLTDRYLSSEYPVKDYVVANRDRVSQAFLEAWDWLKRQGHVVREPMRDNFIISRQGEDFLAEIELMDKTFPIFYSWQSDLPNATNRGFIGECLEQAAKSVNTAGHVDVFPSVERDTAGVPGTPDIAATIFEKIDRSRLFVGDVSIIGELAGGRAVCNPNVAIELGYAAKSLSWNSVLCVCNVAFGSIEKLPFDLRQRRVISYRLDAGQEKAKERARLVEILAVAIKTATGRSG